MVMFKRLANNIKGKHLKIVFPEANDKRVLGAAVRLRVDDLVEPILLGNVEEVKVLAAQNSWNIDAFTIIDPETYAEYDAMVAAFVERRKGKATEEQARDLLKDVSYFGTMLVYMGLADGLVSGAVHSTGDTVRPALQIIKTKPGITRTSGAFIMVPAESDGQKLVFADCAININPSAQELAPEVLIDGELQFDASYSEIVADQKAPGSEVAGHATVYIFPDLQSGNIGYKIAQRLGRYEAVGPILQGLNAPISDLSRGCVEEDVYKVAIITANQALAN